MWENRICTHTVHDCTPPPVQCTPLGVQTMSNPSADDSDDEQKTLHDLMQQPQRRCRQVPPSTPSTSLSSRPLTPASDAETAFEEEDSHGQDAPANEEEGEEEEGEEEEGEAEASEAGEEAAGEEAEQPREAELPEVACMQ